MTLSATALKNHPGLSQDRIRPHTIGRAQCTDIEEILALRHQSAHKLCAEHYSQGMLADWAPATPSEIYMTTLSDNITQGEHRVIICRSSYGVIGYGSLCFNMGEIRALFVHPSHIRTGIGREMLASLEACARRASKNSCHLDATIGSVGFYEACGYVQHGPSKKHLVSGRTMPCVRMSRSVA